MGGHGSGRFPPGGAKTTVSRCRSFGVDWMNREGMLDERYRGTIAWSQNGETISSIGVQRVSTSDGHDALRLRYTVTPQTGDERTYDYRVRLEYTECNFGGERPWFRCPGPDGEECGRRVEKLYTPPRSDLYLCRHCHDLGYESSQESGKHFYENVMKPLERANAAADAYTENLLDHGVLREYYEAQRALARGSSREFGTGTPPDLRGTSTFEEWADRLFSRGFGYGYHGRCTATAKTTGERCRQSAVGEHGKCHYHGGAPGSGIGEDQRDHAAEYLEEVLAEFEEERWEAADPAQTLFDEHDGDSPISATRWK